MKISLQVQMPTTVGEAVTTARYAEEAGFDTVWFSAARTADPFVALTAVAAATSHIDFGSAIVTTWFRHPVSTYQAAVGVQELAEGRFKLGLGVSHQAFVSALGIDYVRPAAAMTEYATIVRALLEEGAVEFHGTHYSTTFESPLPRRDVPIYLAVVGERMSAVAGRIADGILPVYMGPQYVASTVMPALAGAARDSGRATPHVALLAPTSLLTDPDDALAQVREQMGSVPKVPAFAKVFDAIVGADGPAEWNRATADEIVIYGDADRIAARTAAYEEAGVDELVLMPLEPGAFSDPEILRRLRGLW
jgi:alkanesulfonate monooxygenase SsuD/methylene tetrahydromethanopterin reductase-like flavin-dependent oxidoreductase (luciferase family)